MNFRQRFAWLLLFLYLGASIVVALYVFELSERYGMYSLQHEKKFHAPSAAHGGETGSWAVRLWQHLADIPFYLWMTIAFIPYLQLFWVLFVCTKSEPTIHMKACCVPFIGWFYLCSVRCHGNEPCYEELDRIRV